jgi:hypothetical protein
MSNNTFYIVQYNDKYGNGKNKSFEILVKDKQVFEDWLKAHNQEREEEGEMEESADEFDLIPINLFEL